MLLVILFPCSVSSCANALPCSVYSLKAWVLYMAIYIRTETLGNYSVKPYVLRLKDTNPLLIKYRVFSPILLNGIRSWYLFFRNFYSIRLRDRLPNTFICDIWKARFFVLIDVSRGKRYRNAHLVKKKGEFGNFLLPAGLNRTIAADAWPKYLRNRNRSPRLPNCTCDQKDIWSTTN